MDALNLMNKFYRQPGKDPFIKTPADATQAQFGHINAIVENLNQAGSNYKVYVASLTQSGTDAPVANVFVNTLGIDITWSRTGEGEYVGNVSEPIFSDSNTFSSIFSNVNSTGNEKILLIGFRESPNRLQVICQNYSITQVDLDGAALIEVRVYDIQQ